jgi:hypothetical protein
MLYLQLFHGRPDPRKAMENWGENGPVFGPYAYAHTTYASDIRMGGLKADYDDVDTLFISTNDLVYYDGMWYGDWSVFASEELNNEHASRHKSFDQTKSKPL